MAEPADVKSIKRRIKRPLTLEEIQARYYTEGPEAARTSQYFDTLDRPSTSRRSADEPQVTKYDDIELGDVPVKTESNFLDKLKLRNNYEPELSSITSQEDAHFDHLFHNLGKPLKFSRDSPLTYEERKIAQAIRKKQKAYEAIYLSYLEDKGNNPKGHSYLGTDDEDDEDFYNCADDYDVNDWEHHAIIFYKKFKPFILFLKMILQIGVFLWMFYYVAVVLAPLHSKHLPKMKANEELSTTPEPLMYSPTDGGW